MRILHSVAIVLVLAATACGGEHANGAGAAAPPSSDRVYSLESLAGVGWKSKGGFQNTFTPAVSAEWGFLDGREVAAIVYPTPAEAREQGALTGVRQTELTADGTFGPDVERTKCAGFGNYRTPYRLAIREEGPACSAGPGGAGLRGSERCAIELVAALSMAVPGEHPAASPRRQPVCPKRVPTYAEYAVEGNLVLLCEAKPSDGKAECSALAQKLRGT